MTNLAPGTYNRVINKKTGKEYMIPVQKRERPRDGYSKYAALKKRTS